jgi:ABC-type uncharacterized transport system substrate-binding protein
LNAVAAEEENKPVEQLTVAVVEWLPMHAHSQVLVSIQESFSEVPSVAETISFVRYTAYGDPDEVRSIQEKLASDPPEISVGFGDLMCRSLRQACPSLPLIALFSREASWSFYQLGEPCIVLSTELDAQSVWDHARQLRPAAVDIGFIYTDGFPPNEAMVSSLKRTGTSLGGQVTPIRVHPGFCRTEKDFEIAVKDAAGASGFSVLVVPEDPNCARFGKTIYRTAHEVGVATIGTQETWGQGCDMALEIPYATVSAQTAKILLAYFRTGKLESGIMEIAREAVTSNSK